MVALEGSYRNELNLGGAGGMLPSALSSGTLQAGGGGCRDQSHAAAA